MSEYLEQLSETIGHYFTFKVGGFHFGLIEECFRDSRFIILCIAGGISWGPVETCILAIAIATALLSVLNLWRIAQVENRQDRLATMHDAGFRRPDMASLGRRDPFYHRFAMLLAASPIVGISEQHKLLEVLATAGIKGHGHLATFIASKACGAVSVAAFVWLFLVWQGLFAGVAILRLAALIAGLLFGWRLPDLVLRQLAARRRLRIEQGMPDALDLLVISAEAGLSLDQAIEEVSRDLRPSNPVVAEELAITASEMRVLSNRAEALDNLVQRTRLESLRSITASLSQAIRFGTPLAESLRVLAAQMRSERLSRIEERAARLPVLLTIPLLVFIMPGLLIVIGTGPMLRIFDFLSNFRLGGAMSAPPPGWWWPNRAR
jgi:tight adherence protein C